MKRLGAAYSTERVAGLAGVPARTVYYWAKTGLWTPSVSAEREMTWSYADLLALRLFAWLRTPKEALDVKATSLRRIREALDHVEALGDKLEAEMCFVWVDHGGGLHIGEQDTGFRPAQPGLAQGELDIGPVDLLAAHTTAEGRHLSDLRRPRELLRIVPGKLAGEPHVVDTRIPSSALFGLIERGLTREAVSEMYEVAPAVVQQAVDYEHEIRGHAEAA